MNKTDIRKELLNICKKDLQKRMEMHEKAMEEAQSDANAHKGAMESRYDTFKEEAQDRKNAHAKHLDSIMNLYSKLISISDAEFMGKADIGAIVAFEDINYFLFSYIFEDPILIDSKEYVPISLTSPLGNAIRGKSKGEDVYFNNMKLNILDIF